jgi:hypothetical protein
MILLKILYINIKNKKNIELKFIGKKIKMYINITYTTLTNEKLDCSNKYDLITAFIFKY